jgi:LacI family transcriptional regulator
MARVTLQDVAQHAGVSRATASMVVRGTGRLSAETRLRVRQSMDSLGYVYHRGAASLRTRRTGVIGLLTTDVSNPFFAAMTRGFEEQAALGGYLTMMTNTLDDPERQRRLAQSMLEYPVEALAYTPAVKDGEPHAITDASVPTLAVTRGSVPDEPYLGPDDVLGGRLAAEHLIEYHGYRRIVYLGGPRGAGPREDRLNSVRAVAARHADVEVVADFSGVTNVAGGVELAERLLTSGLEFDGVVCHSDVVAFALFAALRRAGRERDVGAVGFDGLPESALFWPPISSVGVGPERLGAAAAQWLMNALEGVRGPVRTLMEPELQIRSSCGCHPVA